MHQMVTPHITNASIDNCPPFLMRDNNNGDHARQHRSHLKLHTDYLRQDQCNRLRQQAAASNDASHAQRFSNVSIKVTAAGQRQTPHRDTAAFSDGAQGENPDQNRPHS